MSLKGNMARSTLVRRCNYHSERVLSTINDSAERVLLSEKNLDVFDMELDSHELEQFDNEKNQPSLGVIMPSTSKKVPKCNYSLDDANRFKNMIRTYAKNVSINKVCLIILYLLCFISF